MSEIVVTGGAGFIGSHLAEKLVKKGYQITVIDNLASGRRENVPDSAEFIAGDIKDQQLLDRVLSDKRVEAVFHLAANPDVVEGTNNPQLPIRENTLATHKLLEAMRENNIPKLVFSSSSTVYGEVSEDKFPLREDYGPLKPISIYGASKLAAESLISAYSEFGIESWIFRLANIVGGRSDHGVIRDFIDKLEKNKEVLEVLGNGQQEKSYLHVSDCVEAMLHGYEETEKRVNVLNVGSEDTIKVKEIAKLVRDQISPEAEIKYTGGKQGWKGDVPRFRLDISKLKDLGWQPEHNSQDSVLRTIEAIVS